MCRREIEFFPWLRATQLATDANEAYHGYFPTENRKRHLLRFNEHILETKLLFACFRNADKGKRMERVLTRDLKKNNSAALFADYFKSLVGIWR